MSVTLTVRSSEIQGKALQDLTQDFCNTLVREKLSAELKTEPPVKGAKGEPITIGVIVLAFITSGAAVALFNAMSAYFARTKKLEFSLKKDSGDTISFKSENITPEEREQTLRQLQSFIGN